MLATIINSLDDLVNVKTEAVVFAFRPSLSDILEVSSKGIKTVQINPASNKSLAKSAKVIMKQQKITCLVGSVQGIRRDKQGNIIDIDIPEVLKI